MSLYRYTPSKAELTAVMLDRALGNPPQLEPKAHGWRATLTAWASALNDGFSAHPWALELAVGARVVGPCELNWMEAGLRTLVGTGLTGAERLDALALIIGHVRGMIQQGVDPSGATNQPERAVDVLMADIIAEHAERYPEVRAAFTDARTSATQDNAAQFGLERILDGLQAVITQRA